MKNGTPRAVWLEREPYTYEKTYGKETYMCAKKPTYVQRDVHVYKVVLRQSLSTTKKFLGMSREIWRSLAPRERDEQSRKHIKRDIHICKETYIYVSFHMYSSLFTHIKRDIHM